MYEEQAGKELSGVCIVAQIIDKMVDSVVKQPGQV
jgi:hypothetical protein